jgi:hypothetical protein
MSFYEKNTFPGFPSTIVAENAGRNRRHFICHNKQHFAFFKKKKIKGEQQVICPLKN